MDEFSEMEIERCTGWLYVGVLPQYLIAKVPNAEVEAMRKARDAVKKLLAAKELRPLMAAYEIIK